jgi:hypothetical protein
MHRLEQCADEFEIAVFIARDSEHQRPILRTWKTSERYRRVLAR